MAGIVVGANLVLRAAEKAIKRMEDVVRFAPNRDDNTLDEIRKTADLAMRRYGPTALVSITRNEVRVLGADLE